MNTFIFIFWGLTFTLTLLHLMYVVYLVFLPPLKNNNSLSEGVPDGISLILFSYNNKNYLKPKINLLLKALSAFSKHELIIIDNGSTDGSKELLNNLSNKNIRILTNDILGVASSINMGVKAANHKIVVFCDLRQQFSDGILQKLVQGFVNPQVGAVSSYLSEVDSAGKKSILRVYENKIKYLESKSGNLLGVYGPLYAINKDCFKEIPADIILEDLYLSLNILKQKAVIIRTDCVITDEAFSDVYNYKRACRYSTGLLQLAFCTKIFNGLSLKQQIMLIWHKYIRLFLPIMFIMSILFILILTSGFVWYITVASSLLGCLLLCMPDKMTFLKPFKKVIQIIGYYLGAPFESVFKLLWLSNKNSTSK